SAVRGSGPGGEGEPLGKAGARGRGPLQGGHGGWPAAATCLSPVPGRQEGGRMRDTGTGDERRGRGGGTRTRSSSFLVRDRSSRRAVHEPRQGLLAGGAVHQGRLDRVLPGRVT